MKKARVNRVRVLDSSEQFPRCGNCRYCATLIVLPVVCVCPDKPEIHYVEAERQACRLWESKDEEVAGE